LVGYPTFVIGLLLPNRQMQDKTSSGNPIRQFLLADDSSPVRTFLKELIHSNEAWRVCAEAEDGQAAVEQAEKFRPDCVILDFAMPGLNGIDAATLIARRSPGTAILLISMHEEDVLTRYLTPEIRGFVAKSRLGSELLPAVEAVLAGGKYFVSSGDGTGGVSAEL
jgi:DNA-binding NarL/FixJ family response regulator